MSGTMCQNFQAGLYKRQSKIFFNKPSTGRRNMERKNIRVCATVADSSTGRVVNNNILSADLHSSTQEPCHVDEYISGKIFQINSPVDLDEFLVRYSDNLIILMCKARTCRPCRAFTRKYMKFAEAHQDVVFLEVFGDDSMDNRRLMVKMKVTGTPTFKFFRHGQVVHTHSGIDEEKFSAFLQEFENQNSVVAPS